MSTSLIDWVDVVYERCPGLIEFSAKIHVKGRTRWSSIHVLPDETYEAMTLAQDLAERQHDVYIGCCTVREELANVTRRGKADERVAAPGVWLDLDIGDVGHAKRKDGLRQCRDAHEAYRIIQSAGFPSPSSVVWTGGGMHAWWLFDEALMLTGDESDSREAQAILAGVHELAHQAGREVGVGIDRLGDVARVLRPPQTYNWKTGDARRVECITLDGDKRYSPSLFLEMCEDVRIEHVLPTASTGPRPDGDALPDAARAATWAQILEPAGWRYSGSGSSDTDTRWQRPGKDESEADSAQASEKTNSIVVFSDSSGLPTGPGQRLTKFRVISHLYFNGSESAASADLTSALKGEATQWQWPREVVERAKSITGMHLDFVKSHASIDARHVLEVRKRRIMVEDANGQRWAIAR